MSTIMHNTLEKAMLCAQYPTARVRAERVGVAEAPPPRFYHPDCFAVRRIGPKEPWLRWGWVFSIEDTDEDTPCCACGMSTKNPPRKGRIKPF